MRRIRPRPRFWRLLILTMLLCFCCSCGAAEHRYRQNLIRLEQLNTEKAALDETIRSLSARLEYAHTDACIQRIARDELNMIFPGEIRYVKSAES